LDYLTTGDCSTVQDERILIRHRPTLRSPLPGDALTAEWEKYCRLCIAAGGRWVSQMCAGETVHWLDGALKTWQDVLPGF
jgi:hypothetical protein